jgi:imidazolonepropionase-like amidohydrolase
MKKCYRGATLLDPSNEEIIGTSTILVKNGRFHAVGANKDIPVPEDAHVVDLNGKFVIPGLIDCHIHVDLGGLANTFAENLVEDKLRTLRGAQDMKKTLRAGFTTVRSVGSVNGIDFAVKAGIEAGYVLGPRMMCAGRIISMTCSGTEYFDGMYRVADGEDECRKAAREQLKDGADFIKLMATGAIMNPGGVPGAHQLDRVEMAAVVEEGLKLGRHAAAHAHGAQGIINAVEAGVRTIEHGTLASDEALDKMAEAETFLVPTFSVMLQFQNHVQDIPAFMVEKSRDILASYGDLVKRARSKGVRIAMGTDAGTNYNFHGNNAEELVYLVEQAISTPWQALASATNIAAQAIMIDQEVGTLKPGKMADFLVLPDNPIKNIRCLLDQESMDVYLAGEPV